MLRPGTVGVRGVDGHNERPNFGGVLEMRPGTRFGDRVLGFSMRYSSNAIKRNRPRQKETPRVASFGENENNPG